MLKRYYPTLSTIQKDGTLLTEFKECLTQFSPSDWCKSSDVEQLEDDNRYLRCLVKINEDEITRLSKKLDQFILKL